MTNQRGRIIMIDGPDGVGKTTQIELLKNSDLLKDHVVHTTRTHGGSPIGEELRTVSFMHIERSVLTDHYISLAMHSALRDDTQNRRAVGEIVLVDRSPLANWAYQVYGSGLDTQVAEHDLDLDMKLFSPDLIICYQASLPTLRAHMAARGPTKQDYFESKPDDYFERVIKGYRFAAARYRATCIDAEQSIDDVFAATTAAIRPLLS